MPIDKVWVLAEAGDSGPTPVTLELLTEARSVASTVEAVAWGSDAAVAGRAARGVRRDDALRRRRPRRRCCPACRWPRRWPRSIEGGNAPDAILLPRHLRRPRHRGAALGQARPSGADQRHRPGGERRRAVEPAPRVRRQPDRHGPTSPARARAIFVIRAKSFAAEPSGGAAAAVVAAPVPETSRPPTRPRSSSATSRSAADPSSTRRRSSCRAGAASARRPTTR